MIFNELRKHGRLAAKRHPMYEKNKVAKILGYVMGAFWAGYLIFFGTTFAFGFSDMVDPLGTKSVQPVLVVSVCPFFLHHYYQVFRYLRCYHLSYRYPAINYCQQLLVLALPHSYQRTYLVDSITYRFLRWNRLPSFYPRR